MNINQSNYRSVHTVNFNKINDQVTTNGYDIDDPDPVTIAGNDLNIDNCRSLYIQSFIQTSIQCENGVWCHYCHGKHHGKFIHHGSE